VLQHGEKERENQHFPIPQRRARTALRDGVKCDEVKNPALKRGVNEKIMTIGLIIEIR
jgi:hypothetical protein